MCFQTAMAGKLGFVPTVGAPGQLTPDPVSMAAISGEIFVLWSVVGSVGKSHLVTQCADVHHAMRPMHRAQSTAPNLLSECAQCNTPKECAAQCNTPYEPNAGRPQCIAPNAMQCATQCAQCNALCNAPNAMRYVTMRPTQCAMQCAQRNAPNSLHL